MGYAHLFQGRIFGAVGKIDVEAKKIVLENIIRDHDLASTHFATFGDGPVEKFSGKRVRVTGVFEMLEQQPYAMLIWRGEGELNGKPVRAGDEFFVTEPQARVPHRLNNTGTDLLEAFKFFPPVA